MAVKTTKGIAHLDNISTYDILKLLKKRHDNDVFVEECKNGETWGARDLLLLDAWVLARTYSPPTTIGYEIKTSRQDFEQDQKWTGYLDLCNQFYFVCPAGLIRSTDLPSGVGLMWVSSTGKLRIKKKAERKATDTTKLQRLLIYVVMSRSIIVKSMHEANNGLVVQPTRLEAKRKIVEDAKAREELAYFISGHVREVYDLLQKKERSLNIREGFLQDYKERLERLGITWNPDSESWQDHHVALQQIQAINKTIDLFAIGNIRTTGQRMKELADTLDALLKEKGES